MNLNELRTTALRLSQVPLAILSIVLLESVLERFDFIVFLAASGLWSSFAITTDLGLSMSVSRVSARRELTSRLLFKVIFLRVSLAISLAFSLLLFLRYSGYLSIIVPLYFLAMVLQTVSNMITVVLRSIDKLEIEIKTGIISRLLIIIAVVLVTASIKDSQIRVSLIGLSLVFGELCGIIYASRHLLLFLHQDDGVRRKESLLEFLHSRTFGWTSLGSLVGLIAVRVEAILVPVLMLPSGVGNYFLLLRVYEVASIPLVLDSSRRHSELVHEHWSPPRSKSILISPSILGALGVAAAVSLTRLGLGEYLVIESFFYEGLTTLLIAGLWVFSWAILSHISYGVTLNKPKSAIGPFLIGFVAKLGIFGGLALAVPSISLNFVLLTSTLCSGLIFLLLLKGRD